MVAQRRQRRGCPGLEDLPGEAHFLRATTPRRGDPRRDGGVRRTPSRGAGGLMELARSSWGDSANAGVAAGDFVLILDGPDQPGIVHAVSGFLFGRGGNIMESQQFFDRSSGWFFMRIDFTLPGTDTTAESLRADFAGIARGFELTYEIWDAKVPYRTLLMVGNQLHCLNDLLFRASNGSLQI